MVGKDYITAYKEKSNITAIRKQAENLKTEIQVYVDQSVNKVEEFVSELMSKRNNMESLWNSTNELVKIFPDSEIVAKYRDEKDKLDAVEDVCMIDRCSVIHRTLVHTDEEKYFDQKLLKIPKSVEFSDAVEVPDDNSEFRSVNIAKDGRVLCGAYSALQIRDPDTLKVLKSVSMNTAFDTKDEVDLQLVQPADAMIALYYVGGDHVDAALLDSSSLKKIRSIHKITCKDDVVGKVEQQGTDVYLVDATAKLLIICSLIENNNKVQKIPIPHMRMPDSICALPDATILIADFVEEGRVIRYTLDKTAELLTEVWQTDVIAEPSGISYDSAAELIYVSSADGHIFIITLAGSLLKTLSCEDLGEKEVQHMAVSGDKIFLALSEDGLRRYTLKY